MTLVSRAGAFRQAACQRRVICPRLFGNFPRKPGVADHRGRKGGATASANRFGRTASVGEEVELRDDHRDSAGVEFDAGMEAPGNTAPAILHGNRPECDKATITRRSTGFETH